MLIQIMISFGISMALTLGMGTLLSMQSDSQSLVMLKSASLAIRQNLVATIVNPRAWEITRTNNPKMNCVPATDKQWCNSGPLDSLNQRLPIKLYDSTGAIVLNDRPDSGFTRAGEPCNGFQVSGSDECPLKVEAFWRVRCGDGSCDPLAFTAPEFVTLTFQYQPGPNSRQIPFDVHALNLGENLRLSYTQGKTPTLVCADRGMIYIGPLATFNSFTADSQGCVPYTAFIGPQGPRGDNGPAGIRGPQGPEGPRGEDRVCP